MMTLIVELVLVQRQEETSSEEIEMEKKVQCTVEFLGMGG